MAEVFGGGSYLPRYAQGHSISENTNSILIPIPQVKEGSEARGAIESVMRIVRKTVNHDQKFIHIFPRWLTLSMKLLTSQYAVTLPPNKKRRVQDGWGMLDAGDFAVHILSRTARKTYFTVEQSTRTWQY